MLVSTNSRAEPKKFLLENIQGTRRVKDATEVDEFRLRLRGCDLSGFDIHSLDLVAVDFRDANLSHTNLGGAILSKSNLSWAKLKERISNGRLGPRRGFSPSRLTWQTESCSRPDGGTATCPC